MFSLILNVGLFHYSLRLRKERDHYKPLYSRHIQVMRSLENALTQAKQRKHT